MKLVHRGSTKDVYESGENYLFHFSDRYSIFDWGEMPDHLNDKGVSLARFTKSVYRYLESKNILTHRLDHPCGDQEMIVKPFKVLRGEGKLPTEENLFIPLEVIFRLGVATGSSLLKRDPRFKELQRFENPMIEFTTKLERFDRPLTHDEARELTGMSALEWKSLLNLTGIIALELSKLFGEHGIELWDGKIEFAFGKFQGSAREIILVDSIGPDELRLTKDGVQLSKEIIREFYRTKAWYSELERVKKEFGAQFKNHIGSPEKLPTHFQEAVEQMYRVLPQVIDHRRGAVEKLNELLPKLKVEKA